MFIFMDRHLAIAHPIPLFLESFILRSQTKTAHCLLGVLSAPNPPTYYEKVCCTCRFVLSQPKEPDFQFGKFKFMLVIWLYSFGSILTLQMVFLLLE